MSESSQNFVSLTEVAGDEVAAEQVERLARRYYWAGDYCRGRDVLEVACGTGQGSGYLASLARSFAAGDFSESLLRVARAHYGQRIPLQRLDAERLPFRAAAFDIVVMFEALYYVQHVEAFFGECRRVLRPGGMLLVASANKDLFDFNPSPHSHRYLGIVELGQDLDRYGFSTVFFGDAPIERASARQRVLRPVKALAVALGLMPKSMSGKKLLKRLVFGTLVRMPAEITAATAQQVPPTPLPAGVPDRHHKVILCAATRRGEGNR